MSRPLRVLMVEDSEDDALLAIHALKKGGFEPTYERVEDARAMRKSLDTGSWEVILCDYEMPKFNGLDAILLLKETGRDIPLIIVSGAIGEETAAECMRSGACDFLVKGKLQRLAYVVERELREAESRRRRRGTEEALQESEERYRGLFQNASIGIFHSLPEGKFLRVNPALAKMLGYGSPEEMVSTITNIAAQIYIDSAKHSTILATILDNDGWINAENRYRRKDGSILTTNVNLRKVLNLDGTLAYLEGFVENITDRKKAESELKELLESLRKAVGATIQAIASATEARDPYTAGHQNRSAGLACAIATEMGLTQEKIEGIRLAGSIHDIGKISIPAEILSKPTELSAIELLLIKEHALKGYEILKDVVSPWPLAEIVHQHHERINGSGYPQNLQGEEILLEARILAVADVVEAMASHRPYRAGLGIDAALKEIEDNRGVFYDRVVADVCMRLFREKGFDFKSI